MDTRARRHVRPYEKLIAWQEAFALCLNIYESTKLLPPEEKFGLAAQIRRSALSVPLNIAEGNGKRSLRDKARFFDIASGSLEELHSQLQIAHGLHFIEISVFLKHDEHIHRVSFLVHALRTAVLRR